MTELQYSFICFMLTLIHFHQIMPAKAQTVWYRAGMSIVLIYWLVRVLLAPGVST